MSVYYLDDWPGDRAPADFYALRNQYGDYSSHATLWVRTDGGGEDLWSKMVVPLTGQRGLAEAMREAVRLAGLLEAERDQMYHEWDVLDALYAGGVA